MDILNTLLTNTYSLIQLKHRLNILKSYLLKTFFGNLQTSPILKEDLDWLNSLPEQFYQQFNKDNVYTIFENLEKLVLNLNPLTIYLTFEPDDITLAQIAAYARKTFDNSNLLLDIKFDPKLIAGCSLVWKGVLKDYSLKVRIEEKKEEILTNFKQFLR